MNESAPYVRLIVLSGARVGAEQAVATAVVLGRLPDCELRLDEAGVSRHHARVSVEGGEVWLKDLDSSNGTHLHGTRVREARLADGDVFEVGGVKVRVRIETAAATAAAPVVEVRQPPAPPPVAPMAASPRESAASDVGYRGRGGALQFGRAHGKRGLLGEDISQSGLLVRFLVIAIVLAAGAVVFWLVYTQIRG